MSEKLTTQLNNTDKAVADISKSRLGGAYKGFQVIPEWDNDTQIDEEKVYITDTCTPTLVGIAPSGNPMDSINMVMNSDLSTGTGSYAMVDFSGLTGVSTYGMSKWFRVGVALDKLYKANKIVYVHGGDIPAGYERAVVIRCDTSGNFQRIAATVTLTASNTLEVVFIPQYGGPYFIGVLSNSWTMTTLTDGMTAQMAFPTYNYHATEAARSYVGGGAAGDWMVTPNYKFNDNGSLYGMTNKAVSDGTLLYNVGSASQLSSSLTNIRTGIHTDCTATSAMIHGGSAGFDVAEKRGIVRPDNSIFFPQYDTEDMYVAATLGSTSNITLYALNVSGAEVLMGSPSSNYRVQDYIVNTNLAGILIKGTGALAEKQKIRVYAFSSAPVNDTTRRGFKCFEYIHPGNVSIDATTNGSYKGTDFQVVIPGSGSIGSEYTFFAYSPDGVAPTLTATRSGTSITPAATDKGNGWVLYTVAENAANNWNYRFKFVFNKSVFFGYFPYSPNYHDYGYSFITHVPTLDDKDYGTSYKFPWTPLDYGGQMSQPPLISFMPLTEEPTTVTVTYAGAPIVYKDIACGVYTTINPKTEHSISTATLVTITSNKPIHVFMHNIKHRTDSTGTYTTWKPGGYGCMPNVYTTGMVTRPTPNPLLRYQVDISESTSTIKSWERAFRVTSRLRDAGIITWDPTSFRMFRNEWYDTGVLVYNTSPIKAEIRYSTDNSTWGAPLALTNGAVLPTPNVGSAQYIDIKFYTAINASAVANRSDDSWIGGFTIV